LSDGIYKLAERSGAVDDLIDLALAVTRLPASLGLSPERGVVESDVQALRGTPWAGRYGSARVALGLAAVGAVALVLAGSHRHQNDKYRNK